MSTKQRTLTLSLELLKVLTNHALIKINRNLHIKGGKILGKTHP
ncbi:MAG: hypothetical protein ACUVT5_05415 [Candidatus Bathyarchaeales archaeon]